MPLGRGWGSGVPTASVPQEAVCSKAGGGRGVSWLSKVAHSCSLHPACVILLWARGQRHTSCKKSAVNAFSFVVSSSTSVPSIHCHCRTDATAGSTGQWERLGVVELPFVHVWFNEPPSYYTQEDLGVARALRREGASGGLVPIYMKGDPILRDWASQSTCGIQATVWGFPEEVLNHSQVSYISHVTLED